MNRQITKEAFDSIYEQIYRIGIDHGKEINHIVESIWNEGSDNKTNHLNRCHRCQKEHPTSYDCEINCDYTEWIENEIQKVRGIKPS